MRGDCADNGCCTPDLCEHELTNGFSGHKKPERVAWSGGSIPVFPDKLRSDLRQHD